MFFRLIPVLIITSAALFNGNFYSLSIQNIYNSMNFYRGFNQIDNLLIDKGLETSARNKAVDLCQNNYFEHDGATTKWQSFFANKHEDMGENLARGYYHSSDVVLAWMKSNLHRDNVLDWEFQKVGVAIEPCGNKQIVVAHFSN
jgi:uncharacterized protein YkwD